MLRGVHFVHSEIRNALAHRGDSPAGYAERRVIPSGRTVTALSPDARFGIAGPVSYPCLRKFFHRDQKNGCYTGKAESGLGDDALVEPVRALRTERHAAGHRLKRPNEGIFGQPRTDRHHQAARSASAAEAVPQPGTARGRGVHERHADIRGQFSRGFSRPVFDQSGHDGFLSAAGGPAQDFETGARIPAA